MQLTKYSDYGLRVLMYVSLKTDGLSTIREISEAYNISENHLMKLIHHLGKLGYIHTVRGKNGGIELARNPDSINIGNLILETETNLNIVECFDPQQNTCPIMGYCRLEIILSEALEAFIQILKKYTLQDLIERPNNLTRKLLRINQS